MMIIKLKFNFYELIIIKKTMMTIKLKFNFYFLIIIIIRMKQEKKQTFSKLNKKIN